MCLNGQILVHYIRDIKRYHTESGDQGDQHMPQKVRGVYTAVGMKPKVLSQVTMYIKTAYAPSSARNSHRSAAASFH
jgi:hypothetical protein